VALVAVMAVALATVAVGANPGICIRRLRQR
jgi:hypothetical protein